MMTPDDIDDGSAWTWAGAHHAHELHPVRQAVETGREGHPHDAGQALKHGRVLLVVDQPNTIGSCP